MLSWEQPHICKDEQAQMNAANNVNAVRSYEAPHVQPGAAHQIIKVLSSISPLHELHYLGTSTSQLVIKRMHNRQLQSNLLVLCSLARPPYVIGGMVILPLCLKMQLIVIYRGSRTVTNNQLNKYP